MSIPTSTEDLEDGFSITENISTEISSGLGGNYSNSFYARYSNGATDFAASCCVIFTLAGVFGNVITILALSKSKRLKNATTAFVVNLCASDLLICAIITPLTAITYFERDWNYGNALCRVYGYLRFSNGAQSYFSMMGITLNRFVLIVYPKFYRRIFEPRKTAMMIAFIWISAFLLMFFPLIEVWGKYGYDPNVGTCSILNHNGKSPKIFIIVMTFFLSSITFIICYPIIFWVVYRVSKRARTMSMNMGSPDSTEAANYKSDRKEIRVLKVMVAILITFIMCYFPVTFVKMFKKEAGLPYLHFFSNLLIYFSSIINPVIYVVMSKEYRAAYRELLCGRPQQKVSVTLSTETPETPV